MACILLVREAPGILVLLLHACVHSLDRTTIYLEGDYLKFVLNFFRYPPWITRAHVCIFWSHGPDLSVWLRLLVESQHFIIVALKFLVGRNFIFVLM